MIVNVDAKALEWAVALYYSQDPVGLQEWYDGVDLHSVNQAAFGLPERVVAKTLLFRILYGGTANGFVNDSDFANVSRKKEFWEQAIEKLYSKYKGLARWHKQLKQGIKATGSFVTPSGREYKYAPKDYGEGPKWDEGAMLNYPIQGFGNDIMKIARIATYKRLVDKTGILLINSVHDSIMVDCESKHVDFVAQTFQDVFDELDGMLSRCYRIDYNVPMRCEIEFGPNWADMQPWNKQ